MRKFPKERGKKPLICHLKIHVRKTRLSAEEYICIRTLGEYPSPSPLFKDAAYRSHRGEVTHARSQSKCASRPTADLGLMPFFNLIVLHCPKIVWILKRYYFSSLIFSPLIGHFWTMGRCVEKISYPIPTPAHQQSLCEFTANANFLSFFSTLKSHFLFMFLYASSVSVMFRFVIALNFAPCGCLGSVLPGIITTSEIMVLRIQRIHAGCFLNARNHAGCWRKKAV